MGKRAATAAKQRVDNDAPLPLSDDDDDFVVSARSSGVGAAKGGGGKGAKRKRTKSSCAPAAADDDDDEPLLQPGESGEATREKTRLSARVFFGADELQPSEVACYPITIRLMDDDIGIFTQKYSKSECSLVKSRWGQMYVQHGVGLHASSKAKEALELREIDASLPWGMYYVLTDVALLRVIRAMKRWSDGGKGAMPASAAGDLVLLD